MEHFYEEVKGIWEERFERVYGFWRGFIDDVVESFLACGDFEGGFARVVCYDCRSEFLVPFSCQRRGFCPSCAATRAAIFGAFLREEVVEQVGHAMWTFTIPKLLRPYFLYRRELLGKLCRAAWETVSELIREAADSGDGCCPGMVAVVHTGPLMTSGGCLTSTPSLLVVHGTVRGSGGRCPTSTPRLPKSFSVIM